jgi:hypothetical protein
MTLKDKRLKRWTREHRKTKQNSWKCACGARHKSGHRCTKKR